MSNEFQKLMKERTHSEIASASISWAGSLAPHIGCVAPGCECFFGASLECILLTPDRPGEADDLDELIRLTQQAQNSYIYRRRDPKPQ
jgi:hypothetical protein